MHKRATCDRCHYPLATCVCHAVAEVNTRHRFIILQHPSEARQAKATARLVKLCINNTEIYQGEREQDFHCLKASLAVDTRPSYLVYPSEQAQAMESIGKDIEPSNFLLLDGSWKKAYKILQLNPWLSHLPALHFAAAEKTRYKIRKAQRNDSLSTLESVAWCLENLDEVDTAPLYHTFEAMIDGQWRFMSQEVKQRY